MVSKSGITFQIVLLLRRLLALRRWNILIEEYLGANGKLNVEYPNGGIFQRSMIKNRIVVIEKSTNKNRTFVLFSCVNLYTFKNLFDIIGTVTRTNSKNMTEPELGIIRYFRVLFYPQKSVLWLLFVTRWKGHLFTIK